MKKYNPTQYSRTLWYDPQRIKNNPRNCYQRNHKFCSIEYQWGNGNNTSTIQQINRPINQTLYNVTIPLNNQPGPKIKHEDITEQSLDDWIAQSMNRTLNSLLNPHKKFFIPNILDEQLKQRYKKQLKTQKISKDETYFKTRNVKSQQKSYLTHKKNNTIDISQLCVQYTKLSPNKHIGKIPITKRQNKLKLKKNQIKRRNAVLLQNDLHYQRFLLQIKKEKTFNLYNVDEERKISESLNKNKLFTLNYQSLRRRLPNQKAPNSIVEYDGIKLNQNQKKVSLHRKGREQLMKQEEQQEIYRMKGNAQAQRAYSIMENFSERTKRTKKRKSYVFDQNDNFDSFSSKKQNQLIIQNIYRQGQNHNLSQNHFRTTSFIDLNNQNQKNNKLIKKLSIHDNQKKIYKPYLGKKVLNLLDSMLIQSENINIQMTLFEQHIEYIPLINFQNYNISHKWIKKAQFQIEKNNLQKAFDCYKQAIIENPNFFNPVYNFAAILQRQHRYKQCLQWLNMAKLFDSDFQKVFYAMALVYFKNQQIDQSLNQINELINLLNLAKKPMQVKYYYIRALCYKKLQKYQKSQKDYRIVMLQSKTNNQKKLINCIFSQIYAKKRRYTAKIDCLSFILLKQALLLILFEQSSPVKEEKINNKELTKKLSTLKFFKRFPVNLIQRLLQVSSYQKYPANQIIFVPITECIIVINGLTVINSHKKSITEPQTVGILQEGDFVGANKIDMYRNSILNKWYITKTQVQLLRLKSLEFQSLWKGQFTFQIDFKYNFLKNVKLFNNLPQSTLLKLCQRIIIQKHSKGTVLLDDLSYCYNQMNKSGKGLGLAKNHLKLESYQDINQILKFYGLFIVINGKIQISDDNGFSNSNIISQRDFFGQNFFLQTNGLNKYGRLSVFSQNAQLYVLKIQDIIWCFDTDDKKIMLQNCNKQQNKKSLTVIKDIKKRYLQKLQIKQKYKLQQ